MLVRDIMHKGVKVINYEHSVEEAARLMEEGDFGAIPVEKDDKMVGMLTDRDIAIRVVAKGKNPKMTKVDEAMSKGITYCFDDEDVAEAGRKMKEHRQRRLPVVNREKRLVGVISLAELTNKPNDPNLTHEVVSKVTH